MLHHADELFEARFALITPPTFGAGVGMPRKEENGANETRPDFRLNPMRILAFGFI